MLCEPGKNVPKEQSQSKVVWKKAKYADFSALND